MPTTILGLDIGGANLKAATADQRAVSVPFALWKQPDKLPSALAELIGKFPDAEELAVTMTGELCDCFETKRQGVEAIVSAVERGGDGRPIRFWSTDGVFLGAEEARRDRMKVAAANWHALATLVGNYVPNGPAILVDIGSTTADIIPILDGVPVAEGKTDDERIRSWELVYTGVRRTPLCALMGWQGAAELFATTLDAYLILGMIPEDPSDCDTADGRPATKNHARARLCRMYCSDAETISPARIEQLAKWLYEEQLERLRRCEDAVRERLLNIPNRRATGSYATRLNEEKIDRPKLTKRTTYIISGSGEFLARQVVENAKSASETVSLSERLGPEVSSCAPAYAVAVLATELR
jgi:(4-(4-[2-(gamma-L-glutamylamino)ethyl]phenoxymethyl)furan-2-yl)methanamine synthase